MVSPWWDPQEEEKTPKDRLQQENHDPWAVISNNFSSWIIQKIFFIFSSLEIGVMLAEFYKFQDSSRKKIGLERVDFGPPHHGRSQSSQL